MTRNNSVMDVLTKAFNESKGKTVNLVIEHGELIGVTPDMMDWWNFNLKDSIRYKMWYPQDHVSFEWEVPPGRGQIVQSIGRAEEKIGEFSASILRLRREDPNSVPFHTIYRYFRWSNILAADDKPLACLCHEYDPTPRGIKMRSTFKFPAKTPRRFLNAMHKHCLGEMSHLAEILPAIYRQNIA